MITITKKTQSWEDPIEELPEVSFETIEFEGVLWAKYWGDVKDALNIQHSHRGKNIEQSLDLCKQLGPEWRLPTKEEFHAFGTWLYKNQFRIKSEDYRDVFATGFYWTSTDTGEDIGKNFICSTEGYLDHARIDEDWIYFWPVRDI